MSPEGHNPDIEEVIEYQRPYGTSTDTPTELETMTPEEAANMMLGWGQPEIPKED